MSALSTGGRDNTTLYILRKVRSRNFPSGGGIFENILGWAGRGFYIFCFWKNKSVRLEGWGEAVCGMEGDAFYKRWVIGTRGAKMKTPKTGTTLGLPSRVRDWVLERLQWEDWKELLKHARLFAKGQIRGRRWRGVKFGGRVLPEGHDAESVASEAAAAMLPGECRLALGWTWERLTRELERLVSNEVRRLHALKETREMRNEWDILPARADGELQSIFPTIAGTIADPSEEAMRHEEEAARARREVEVDIYLGRDKGARGVFRCLCKGYSSGVRSRRSWGSGWER